MLSLVRVIVNKEAEDLLSNPAGELDITLLPVKCRIVQNIAYSACAWGKLM